MSVKVPVFASGAPIDDVIQFLVTNKKASFVTLIKDKPKLIFIGQLMSAQEAGAIRVGDIAKARRLSPVTPPFGSRARGIGNLPVLEIPEQHVQFLGVPPMPRKRSLFELEDISRTSAVISSSKYSVENLVVLFVCTDPSQHFFPEPFVMVNAKCPLCITSPGGIPATVRRLG